MIQSYFSACNQASTGCTFKLYMLLLVYRIPHMCEICVLTVQITVCMDFDIQRDCWYWTENVIFIQSC